MLHGLRLLVRGIKLKPETVIKLQVLLKILYLLHAGTEQLHITVAFDMCV